MWLEMPENIPQEESVPLEAPQELGEREMDLIARGTEDRTHTLAIQSWCIGLKNLRT